MLFCNFHLELKESMRNLKQLEQGIIFININFYLGRGEGKVQYVMPGLNSKKKSTQQEQIIHNSSIKTGLM
jgi:hypothetical protein